VPRQLKLLKKPSSVCQKRDAKGPARHAPPSAPFLIGATAIRTAEIARKMHVARRYADRHLAALFAALYPERDAKGVTSPEKFVAVPNIYRSPSALPTGTDSQTETAVNHSKQTMETFLTETRITFSELPRMWLIGASLHLTNCRLNRLQLFPFSRVCNKRRLREIAARVWSIGAAHPGIGAIHTEASFVVE
jgi:hypothetical protein